MGSTQKEAALRSLHDRHAPELWRFALRLTHDPQVAEDVVQEALLRAWKDPGLVELREQSVADRTGEVLDRWLIADALGELSADHRAVIAAAYYEGRSVAEIADLMRIPEGTVKSRLHYGLRSLRLALQEKGVTRP